MSLPQKITYFSLQWKHKLFKKYFQKDVMGAGMQSRREKNAYKFQKYSDIKFVHI